jgi:rhodanese-related sulfurtransferase
MASPLIPRLISCHALKTLMDEGRAYALFDVRERGEYSRGQIWLATSLPRREIEFRLPELVPVKRTPVVVYDEGGERASLAAATMARMGYGEVRLLEGGLPAWEAAGYPTVTGVNVPSKAFGEEVHAASGIPEITPEELKARRARGARLLLLDTRTPEEYRRSTIPGALNVPGGELILLADDLASDPSTTVVVNCGGRTRSIIGTQALRRLGLDNVTSLKNGTMGWVLAGFELERGATREPPRPSPVSHQAAQSLAERLAAEEEVPFISISDLRTLSAEADRETLYLFDVRSQDEYAAGHIPGTVWVPGGQAVQQTDDHVAVPSATIVLTCDGIARSVMTAAWFRRMGLRGTCVLRGGARAWVESGQTLEQGMPGRRPFGLDQARVGVSRMTASELAARLWEPRAPLILDVGTSREFEARHLPGARWLPRGWLELKIGALASDRSAPLVVTCANGEQSTLAAATLGELGYGGGVTVLDGGLPAWSEAGYPFETGLTEAVVEPNDVWLSPNVTGDRAAMLRYLEWELALGQKHEAR